MRQPHILVRFAGTPLTACLLIIGAALLIYGWYQGQVEWWIGLAAVGVVFRTLQAVSAVRRFKTWRGEWEAMGRVDDPPPPATLSGSWKRRLLTVAALIAIPMLASQPAIQGNPAMLSALRWAWGLLVLYCLFRMLLGLRRRIARRLDRKREARIEKGFDDPITLAVGHPSDGPTRASAQRNLPDYCLRLVGRD
jgi:uncharacterized membrane protein YfcA